MTILYNYDQKLKSGPFTIVLAGQEEEQVVGKVKAVWAAILKADIAADTDFFGAGAGSMDVVRWDLLYTRSFPIENSSS